MKSLRAAGIRTCNSLGETGLLNRCVFQFRHARTLLRPGPDSNRRFTSLLGTRLRPLAYRATSGAGRKFLSGLVQSSTQLN